MGTQCSVWTETKGASFGMRGQADGDVARGNLYPNTALTPLTPVAYRINGRIDTHGESETTERNERRSVRVFVFVCL